MSEEPAEIRAHYTKIALKRVRAMPAGQGAAIRERVGTELQQRVRSSSSLDWLPLSLAVQVCDAIIDVLGEQGARRFWTELMFDSYDRGMLKPLTAMARGGLGQSGSSGPGALLELAPRAFALSTRGCGSLEFFAREGGGVTLTSVNLRPEITRSRGFHCLFFGACQAMLDQFRSGGTVEVLRNEGGLTYDVRLG